MARNVFISFRYSDGHLYKDDLASKFDASVDTVDYSEDEDRFGMSESTIKNYLYGKLKRSSVTIVLLTPQAITYKKDYAGRIDDWIYDEVRYSLEDRDGNATNGLIGVYVPEVEDQLFQRKTHICSICNHESTVLSMNDFPNLVRRNMMNVRPQYKKNKCLGVFDRDYDSYCSLISYSEFVSDIGHFVDLAFQKRTQLEKYELHKRL